jgi:hypothetical protein
MLYYNNVEFRKSFSIYEDFESIFTMVRTGREILIYPSRYLIPLFSLPTLFYSISCVLYRCYLSEGQHSGGAEI